MMGISMDNTKSIGSQPPSDDHKLESDQNPANYLMNE